MMLTQEDLLLQYAKSLESREFASARQLYENIKSNLKGDEWSRGYLHALRGVYFVKKNDDQHSPFSRMDLDVKTLKEFLRRFSENMNNPLFADFDRGYFTAVADYVKALTKLKSEKKTG